MSASGRLDGLVPSQRNLLEAGWDVRRWARPAMIRLDRLTKTRAVSVTGRACAADCAHCGGHYLAHMLGPEAARREAGRALAARDDRLRSWLVSGGCERDGRVPLLRDESLLGELGRAGRLNLHTGLVRSDEEARVLAGHATVVSLDFTVDQAAIDETYGFDGVKAADFVESYVRLRAETRVVPHLLVGLAGGRIRGEREALQELLRLGADTIVFLVLVPTPGSRFGDRCPPTAEEVAGLLAEARLLFPEASLNLGCMRPKGSYRENLDHLALWAGVDRIAVPTPAVAREAERLGLRPVWSDECCTLNQDTPEGR